jgi:Ran GTPase-activating protein 1
MSTFSFDARCLDDKREMVDKARAVELLAPLHAAIESSQVVTKLTLCGKSFGIEAATYIGSVFGKLPATVTSIDFNDCIAGQKTEDVGTILQSLCSPLKNQPLVEINLSNNALGHRGVSSVADMLANQPNLQRLYFNNDGLQGDAVALITKLVLGSQQDGTSRLRVFEIFNNMMGDAGAIALAPLLAASPILEEFRMATTRVSKAGGKAVVAALVNCKCLTRLDLSDNTLGDDAGTMLASIVQQNPNLRILRLGDVGIERISTKAILKALASSKPNLEELDLQHSDIGSGATLRSLIRFVLSNERLNKLQIESTNLKNRGAQALLKDLGSHSALQYLSLRGNELTSKVAPQIVNYLTTSAFLLKLDVNGNAFDSEALESIRNAVSKPDSLDSLSENDEEGEVDEDNDDCSAEEEEEVAAAAAQTDVQVDAITDALQSVYVG